MNQRWDKCNDGMNEKGDKCNDGMHDIQAMKQNAIFYENPQIGVQNMKQKMFKNRS